ncbi:hypothetical protein BBAD15_g12474 [Beauveria bassiana D1-5]|uniref:Uncharacterized protein n=1 Tax=Beauveria bassiana D1-5 TaxID=1245745 RepID=A0A0A2V3G2_BEABA|nr:hypothetical protein BBAD15_g12474 [Beauveria bassiana D1-5]
MRWRASDTPSSAVTSPIAMPSAAMKVTSFMPRNASIWRRYGVIVSAGTLGHAFRRITERDAGAGDMIQIGLELRRQVEVVDRHGEHDTVGLHQLGHQGIAAFDDALLLDAAGVGRREQGAGGRAVEVRQRLGADIANGDDGGRIGLLDAGDQVVGQLLAVRTLAQNRGQDDKGLHNVISSADREKRVS